MGWSPVAIQTVHTTDFVAPGAPGLVVEQVDNSTGRFTLTPPTVDADGSELTGLTYAQAVVVQMDEVEAEQFREHFDDVLQLNGAQPFIIELVDGDDPDADPDPIMVPFAIVPGKVYTVFARCADHPLETP